VVMINRYLSLIAMTDCLMYKNYVPGLFCGHWTAVTIAALTFTHSLSWDTGIGLSDD